MNQAIVIGMTTACLPTWSGWACCRNWDDDSVFPLLGVADDCSLHLHWPEADPSTWATFYLRDWLFSAEARTQRHGDPSVDTAVSRYCQEGGCWRGEFFLVFRVLAWCGGLWYKLIGYKSPLAWNITCILFSSPHCLACSLLCHLSSAALAQRTIPSDRSKITENSSWTAHPAFFVYLLTHYFFHRSLSLLAKPPAPLIVNIMSCSRSFCPAFYLQIQFPCLSVAGS